MPRQAPPQRAREGEAPQDRGKRLFRSPWSALSLSLSTHTHTQLSAVVLLLYFVDSEVVSAYQALVLTLALTFPPSGIDINLCVGIWQCVGDGTPCGPPHQDGNQRGRRQGTHHGVQGLPEDGRELRRNPRSQVQGHLRREFFFFFFLPRMAKYLGLVFCFQTIIKPGCARLFRPLLTLLRRFLFVTRKLEDASGVGQWLFC